MRCTSPKPDAKGPRSTRPLLTTARSSTQPPDEPLHNTTIAYSHALAMGRAQVLTPPPKSTMKLLARKLRPKMALGDTLWVYHGKSLTARLAELRNFIPHHTQRAMGPLTIYTVPHPITAQCTHCNPRCAHPCGGTLQQPLPIPTEGAYTVALYPETQTLTSYPRSTATTA